MFFGGGFIEWLNDSSMFKLWPRSGHMEGNVGYGSSELSEVVYAEGRS
jgi:hypothetical protein